MHANANAHSLPARDLHAHCMYILTVSEFCVRVLMDLGVNKTGATNGIIMSTERARYSKNVARTKLMLGQKYVILVGGWERGGGGASRGLTITYLHK